MSAMLKLADELEREASEVATATSDALAEVRVRRLAARRIREAAAKDAAELERLRGFAEDYRTLCETLMGSHGGWLEEAQCHAEQHLDALEADS